MPQSGDGDLWPTDDDDTSSKSAEGDATHQLPVPPQRPDQQEQRRPSGPAAGGWFDQPGSSAAAADKPAASPRGDEPHAEPAGSEPLRFTEPKPPWPGQSDAQVGLRFEQPVEQQRQAEAAADRKKADESSGDQQPADQAQAEQPSVEPRGDEPRWSEPKADEPPRDEPVEAEPRGADQSRTEQPESNLPDLRQAEQQTELPRRRVRKPPDRRPLAGSDESTASEQPFDVWQAAEQRSEQEKPAEAQRPRADQEASDQERPADQRQEPDQERPAAQRPRSSQWPSDLRQPEQQRQRPGQPPAEPRRRPEQQRTQPVSWPVADLERQAHNQETTRNLQIPQPKEDEPTSFFSRPLPAEQRPPRRADAEATSYLAVPLRHQSPPREDPPQLFSGQPRQEWPPPEPPRAAPVRVGPPRDEPEAEPEPEPRKRNRKPLLIAAVAIVAVVGIAAGVVFGVPGLAAKLGLSSDDPGVAIEPPAPPINFEPGLRGPDGAAPTPTAAGVEAALAGPAADSALGNLTGIVIDPATGQALWQKDGETAIVPASTGKILTAAAALLSLDHTTQLVTKVVEGEEPGSVVIVGGGDSTLSSLKPGLESVYPGAAHLTDLVDQVKASGAQVQTVYVDLDRYTGPKLAPSWEPADVGLGYITPIVPAMLDGGRADATEDYSTRTDNPAGGLVDEFASRIGATAPESAEAKAPANAKVLGEVRSAPMAQLVDNLLNHSDNVLAESVAREVAIKAGEPPSFDGASKATLDVLRQNDFNVDGVSWVDASGLSAEDKVPAKLLGEILAVAAGPDGKDPRTAKLRPLLGGLPVAGGSGTLGDRYGEAGATDGKGWVRAKTGSLTGVNSLAGIVLDKDNRPLVFAFLTSGTTATTARPALDRVSAALRGCGCQ